MICSDERGVSSGASHRGGETRHFPEGMADVLNNAREHICHSMAEVM